MSGRCLRGVFAAPGALHLQFVERQVVHHGWDLPPRANNTGVEQSWRVSRGDCGVGSTSLESRGASRSWARQSGQGSLWPGWWQKRLVEEQKLWGPVAWVPDVQCAWQVLVQCAGPRCHHFLRTLPPSQTGEHADGHDLGMMQAMERVCWEVSPEKSAIGGGRTTWLRCQCGLEDWVPDQRAGCPKHVLVSCRMQPDPWTSRVSSPVLLGRSSAGVSALPWQTVPSR